MERQIPPSGNLLPPYRVLDLTDDKGVFCAKLLADYGADVVPAGSRVSNNCGGLCCVCGNEGFLKRDGTRYAEVHHVEEVSTRMPGVLASKNIIILCLYCHRMMHYADVQIQNTKTGWRMLISGDYHDVSMLHKTRSGA